MKKGIAIGVGVGPGDPEMMTLKAVKTIRENEVFCFPSREPRETAAFKIAVQAVPELADKELVPIYMPMVTDKDEIKRQHRAGADKIESYLDKGRNIVFLTLGDSTIYCTFTYLQTLLEADGYETKLINGIPSFCAAAARLNMPLVEWDEPLHVIPAMHKIHEPMNQSGSYVLMKSGTHMGEVKKMLNESARDVNLVINCGMPGEKVYRSVDEIPDDSGYFALVIAKEKERPL